MFTSGTPQTDPVLTDVGQGFSALVQIAKDVLVNPDIAYRQNRQMSEQMIRDPMIMAPLSKRMLATAQLDWEIVPEEENAKDPEQMATAKQVENIIRKIPHRTDFFKDLLWGVWKGTGVSEADWDFNHTLKQWVVTGHRPHNGDKFTYDIWGKPRILVRQNQTAGRELTDGERDRLIIHVYDPEDGSFYDGAEAGYLYKGRGLRDLAWHYWWLKHNALRFWLQFMERFGGGMAIGRYPMGNAAAKNAIEAVLQNLLNDSKISMPVPAGAGDKEQYGIELTTVSTAQSNARLFQDFVDGWAGKHLRLLIEGQEQANQESGDGLGSNRADKLMDIFKMYVKYDAGSLSDTLSDELVARIMRFNFPSAPYKLKFKFIVEEDDYADQKDRVTAAKDLGLVVPKTWAYEALDIPQPQLDEEVIDFGAMQQAQLGIGFSGQPGMEGMDANLPGAGDDGQPLFSPESFSQEEAQAFKDALAEALEYEAPRASR